MTHPSHSVGARHARILLLSLLVGAAPLAACGDDAPATPVDAGGGEVDGGPRDAGPPLPPATGIFPAHDRTLPFVYTRPDVGAPVSAAERAAITDQYLALMARIGWLDFMEERVHGWPESEGRYFYATWWSGAGVRKSGGAISYVHVAEGAENNGLRTPQIMEGVCYAYRLYGNAQDQHLVRRLVRGLSSWSMAMDRTAGETERGLLMRAAYPPSVIDTARGISIVYDAARPGPDSGSSQYVHLPASPHWGDLWIKSIRSKDDMGHIMRGLGALDACDGTFTEPGAQDDLVDARRRYQEWARRVVRDRYQIATYSPTLEVVVPPGSLATYFVRAGIECGAGYAIPLMATGSTGGYTCDNAGLGPVPDPSSGLSNSNLQILRSHHEGAVALALAQGQGPVAESLVPGLAARIEGILDAYETGTIPDNAHPSDVFQLIVESALLGVPLTSREVRWLHGQIAEAQAGYDTTRPEWNLRAASTTDGDYLLDPSGPGIDVKDLGLLLGLCVAPYLNPASREVLDCDRIRAFGRPARP